MEIGGGTMLRKTAGVVGIALGLLRPCSLPAEDVYAVRFVSVSSINGFWEILWRDDIVFHNTTAQDATVRLLAMSNGGSPEPPTELRVPAHATVSASADAASRTNWFPRTGEPVPLWVVHLDVPPGIVVQSRAEAHSTTSLGGIPPSPVPDLGVFSLPVFRTLTPASTPKVHLGADLSTGTNFADANYTNVGIYNAASVTANAIIQLRQGCNDALLEERRVEIAPDTIVQIGGLRGTASGCPVVNPGASSWMKYVTVEVDQPSLSYIVNKKPGVGFPPVVPYGSAFSQ
jgi:hypothetical protein